MLEQYHMDGNNEYQTCDTTTPFSVKDILNMDNDYTNYYFNVKREYGHYDFGANQQFWDNSAEAYHYYHHQEADEYLAKSAMYPSEPQYGGFYEPEAKDQKDYLKGDSPSKFLASFYQNSFVSDIFLIFKHKSLAQNRRKKSKNKLMNKNNYKSYNKNVIVNYTQRTLAFYISFISS
nr:PREDICTED: uncharacterized protein LOC663925 [Tribolium castaneum]|eukprot:XP_015838981.1 PREDICTED: uncharacterized protein LOC663925 [Tribolium castaneum]